jgi:hypothetical protein
LRKWAAEQGSSEDIVPHWNQLGTYMHMRGGPTGKPYFRPLWHTKGTDPGRFWLGSNLAGSYSPSSLRNVLIRVVAIRGEHYALRDGHARLAHEHLLYEQPLAGVALAAYLYRDFGFLSTSALGPEHLLEALAEDFHYTPGDEQFELLFAAQAPNPPRAWFERLTDDEESW